MTGDLTTHKLTARTKRFGRSRNNLLHEDLYSFASKDRRFLTPNVVKIRPRNAQLTLGHCQLPTLRSTRIMYVIQRLNETQWQELTRSTFCFWYENMTNTRGKEGRPRPGGLNVKLPCNPTLCQVTWMRTITGLTPVIFTSSSQNHNKEQCNSGNVGYR
jgi:hypothetical protein